MQTRRLARVWGGRQEPVSLCCDKDLLCNMLAWESFLLAQYQLLAHDKLHGRLFNAEAAPETLLGWTHRFTSVSDFLSNYEPHRLELLLPYASSQMMGVKCAGPSVVALWHTFNEDCGALLRVLRDGGPVNLVVPATSADVGSEDSLRVKLLTQLLVPLQQALSRSDGFFEADCGTHCVTKGIWTNASAGAAGSCNPSSRSFCDKLVGTWRR